MSFPKSANFNYDFSRLAQVVARIINKSVKLPHTFVQNQAYSQEEIDANFKYLTDLLELYCNQNCGT